MRGHIRKRGKSWAVVVYFGRDQNGKERHKWYSHANRREAEAHLTQLLVQMQAGGGVPPGRLRTGDFLDQWLGDDVRGRLAPTTDEIYSAAVERVKPAIGHIPLSRCSPPTIQGCLNALASNLSAATVHQTYRSLNTALNTAVRWGLLIRNPCDHVKPPRVDARPATVWDEEQVRLFVAEARRGSRYYRLYLSILLTGMRPGEALALRWRDITWGADEIVVRQKFYRLGAQQIWGATKNHRQYAVSVPPILMEELRKHREDQREQKARWGERYDDRDLVFCQPNGKPMHERNIYRRDFQGVIKRAKLPRIRLYDLRHCCATHMADQGTPIHVIQRQLGHGSPTVALRYYIHPLQDSRLAVNQLAERLLGHRDR